MNNTDVPIWERYTLTIEEASKYFRIGEKKLRRIAEENKGANWVIMNGNRIIRAYHYSVITGHGWRPFPKVACRSLRESLTFFSERSRRTISAGSLYHKRICLLYSVVKEHSAYQPVKAYLRTNKL